MIDDSNQRGCSEFALSALPVLPAVAHTGSPVTFATLSPWPFLLTARLFPSSLSASSMSGLPKPYHLFYLYKLIIMFPLIVLIVHLVGKFLLKAVEKNSVKSGTSSAYLSIIAMMNENEGVKENLTPFDNSFSTAAFSRAISPRTILKEVLTFNGNILSIERRCSVYSYLPTIWRTLLIIFCMTADPVKGDIHSRRGGSPHNDQGCEGARGVTVACNQQSVHRASPVQSF